MSVSPVVGILGVGLALVALLATLRTLRGRCHPELLRKFVHIGMGLATLSFPWIFPSPWPVVVLCVLSVTLLLVLRYSQRLQRRFGGVLDGVERRSLGEIYFPLGVSAIYVLAQGDKIAYVVPLTLLTLCDAVAALVGVRYGMKRYSTDEGSKSWEGSVAFLLVAFLAVHLPLLLFTDVGRVESVLIAANIAILIAVLEAASSAGLDNLFIPLGSFALLGSLRRSDAASLAVDLGAAVLLVVFAMLWRRRTTLTDSAAVGAALVAFVAATVGGWRWVLPPLTLFVLYAIVFPPHSFGNERPHTMGDVARASAVGLLWCLAAASFKRPDFLIAYTTAFGAHLAIIGVARSRSSGPGPVLGSWLVSCAALFVPFALVLVWAGDRLTGLGMAFGVGGVLVAAVVEGLPLENRAKAWLRQGVVAVASVVPLLAGGA